MREISLDRLRTLVAIAYNQPLTHTPGAQQAMLEGERCGLGQIALL